MEILIDSGSFFGVVQAKPAHILIFLGGVQVWLMKLVALVVGYKVVRVGAELLREGVTGEFKFQGDFQGFKADLISASPGLLFVVIGGFIVAFALFVDKPLNYGSTETTIDEASESVRFETGADLPPNVELPPLSEEVEQ